MKLFHCVTQIIRTISPLYFEPFGVYDEMEEPRREQKQCLEKHYLKDMWYLVECDDGIYRPEALAKIYQVKKALTNLDI